MSAGQITEMFQVARGMDDHAGRPLDERLNNKAAGLLTVLFYQFLSQGKISLDYIFCVFNRKRMAVSVRCRDFYGGKKQPVKSFMK